VVRVFPLLIVLFLVTTVEAQDHVQIDFDDWPPVVCPALGDPACEGALAETVDPTVADHAAPVGCGTGGCFRLRWPEDQAIRRIRTPWNPGPDTLTAFAQVRLKFEADYYPNGVDYVGVQYQPLVRFFGMPIGVLGIDVAVIQRGDGEPRIAIVSAPDADIIGGVRYVRDLDRTCFVDGPFPRGFVTIQATIELDPTGGGNDRCELVVGTRRSMKSGLDFRDMRPEAFEFRYASFFGRVSNSSSRGPCNVGGWPPCGDTDPTRTIIADDLCVSTDLEAGTNGRCDPTPPVAEDAGAIPEDSGAAPDDSGAAPEDSGAAPRGPGREGQVTFRGTGGCTCDAAGRRGTSSSAVLALAVTLLLLRRRRAR